MGEKPYKVEETNAYSRAWKAEFKRRQMAKFKQEQLQRAKDDAYWDFVYGDLLG